MVTMVKHTETGKHSILLGTGLGMYKSARPGVFFGNLNPAIDECVFKVVAVSDQQGYINWFESDKLQVTSVDGHSPAELLESFVCR